MAFYRLFFAAVLGAVGLLTGCSTQPPTIAHTHIGHAITGWIETPGKTGLLVTAEREAAAVDEYANKALAAGSDLAKSKAAITDMLHAVQPKSAPTGRGGLGFGLLPAVIESISHLEFAAASEDATENVRESVPKIAVRSKQLIGSCRQIEVLAGAILESQSVDEASLLTDEVVSLSSRIIDNPQSGGYGLRQMRRDLEAMIAREQPPYTTVPNWYLFNLIRLPTGEWKFEQRTDASSGGYPRY